MLALGSVVLYAVAFLALRPVLGSAGVRLLAMLPVAVMGWYFGPRSGLIAGLLTLPLDTLLANLAGETGWDVVLRREGGLAVSMVLALIGAAIGQVSDLSERLKREIVERKRAEEEREHLLVEAREQRALAQALYEVATTLNSTPNFDQVLDRILSSVDRVVSYDEANIMLVRFGVAYVVRSRGYIERGLEASSLAVHIPVADTPYLHFMAESGQSRVVPDTQADPDWVQIEEARSVRSYVGAPLRPKGQTIGFLNLNSATPNFFTSAHAARLQAFTDQAAVALENAQLYDAIRHQADVLEQRVAQRTRQLSEANAQLQQIDRLKDEFLASMSHELRTPLNAILGLSEALLEQVYGPLTEKQIQCLRSIETSGRHLLSLITDILDLAKMGACKFTLEIGPVSAESVCQASLQLVRQAAHKKQLKITSTLDSKVKVLQADERRLKQILVNLLSNAVKFTPEGGAIGLEVVGDAENQMVHFTVWDNGIGIAEEDMPRLFQPFVQLDSRLSRQHAGTGLGLALVYGMTEMHGGSVSVESKIEAGSRFTVTFPWRQPPELSGAVTPIGDKASAPPQAARPQDGRVAQSLILLVEDNETSANALLDYLPTRGYHVILARNGAEAIERTRQGRPDVILMDMQMPGMDGLEATRRIRADAELAATPVIALTAMAMPGDRERCLAAGADDYISKPIKLQELMKAIEAQLSNAQYRQKVSA